MKLKEKRFLVWIVIFSSLFGCKEEQEDCEKLINIVSEPSFKDKINAQIKKIVHDGRIESTMGYTHGFLRAYMLEDKNQIDWSLIASSHERGVVRINGVNYDNIKVEEMEYFIMGYSGTKYFIYNLGHKAASTLAMANLNIKSSEIRYEDDYFQVVCRSIGK